MEGVRTFLESSTIHGLSYIATTRKFVRILWILIVIAGFIGAGFIINESFQNWQDSPVTTTIETLPKSQIEFPKVTVCPPKGTFTNLNYDLMMTKNMTLDPSLRENLFNLAMELIIQFQRPDTLTKLNLIDEENRFRNWYYGYTDMKIPVMSDTINSKEPQLRYTLRTSATKGKLTTQYFGDKYNISKISTNLDYSLYIFTKKQDFYSSLSETWNQTITFEIKKISMKGMTTGAEDFQLDFERLDDVTYINRSFSKGVPNSNYNEFHKFTYTRTVPSEEIKRMNAASAVPGFQIKWYYNDDYISDPLNSEPSNRLFKR